MAWFFGLHNYSKPGRGIRKDEPKKTGFSLYFEILFKRFWKILTINSFFFIFSFPAMVISYFLSSFILTWMMSAIGIDINSELSSSIFKTSIFITIVLIQLLGTGPASAGMTYVLRKYVNDTHAWVWSDFFDNFKSNFRQSMAVYFINILFTCCSLVCYTFYSYVVQGLLGAVLRGAFMSIAAVFVMMQMYTYQLMVGFKVTVKKIYKYAAILVIVRLPQNIIAAAVSAFLMYATYEIFIKYPPIGLVLLIGLFYSLITFTQIFMTNNTVNKYISNPSASEQDTEKIDSDFVDTV